MISDKKYLINADLDQNIFSFIDNKGLIEICAVNKLFNKNIKDIILEREEFSQTWLYRYIEYLVDNNLKFAHKLNTEKFLAKKLHLMVRIKFIEYLLQEFNLISEKSFSFIIFCCTQPFLLYDVFPFIFNRFKFIEDLDEINNLVHQLNELANNPVLSRISLEIIGNLYQKQAIEVDIEQAINFCSQGMKYFRHPVANLLIKLFSKKHSNECMQQQISNFLKLESLSQEELQIIKFFTFKTNKEQANIVFDKAIKFYQNNDPKIKGFALQALKDIASQLDQKIELYPIVLELINEKKVFPRSFFKILPKEQKQNIISSLILEGYSADMPYKNILSCYFSRICEFSEQLNNEQIKDIFNILVSYYNDKDQNMVENSVYGISLIFKRLYKQNHIDKAFNLIINSDLNKFEEKEAKIAAIRNIFKYLNKIDKNIALNILLELCDDPNTLEFTADTLVGIFSQLNNIQKELVFEKLNFINSNIIELPGLHELNSDMIFDIKDLRNKMLINFSYEKFLDGTNLYETLKSRI